MDLPFGIDLRLLSNRLADRYSLPGLAKSERLPHPLIAVTRALSDLGQRGP